MLKSLLLIRGTYMYCSAFLWFSISFENMYMSSRYTHTSTPIRLRNMNVISLCHEDSPLQSPCWRQLLMKVPSGDVKSVLGMSSGITCICSYASVMSITDVYLCDATASRIMSWFGSGVELSIVLAFLSRVSITVCNSSSVPAFGMASNGNAFLPLASFHHPAAK